MKFTQSAGKSVRASLFLIAWKSGASFVSQSCNVFDAKPIILYDTQMKTTLSINIRRSSGKIFIVKILVRKYIYSETGATPWIISVFHILLVSAHISPILFPERFPFRWTRDEKWSSCSSLRYCASENQFDQALRMLYPIHSTAFLDDC